MIDLDNITDDLIFNLSQEIQPKRKKMTRKKNQTKAVKKIASYLFTV